MQSRLRELVEINRAIIGSLDYDHVLRLVVDKTAAFTGADSCALLLQGEDDLVRPVAVYGIDETKSRSFAAPLDEKINVALRELVPFGADDTFLGAPVIGHDRIRGVLVVHWKAGGASGRDEDDEFLVSALADQAAIALDHAERYRDVSRLSEHKSRLLETIQSNTSHYLAYVDRALRFVEANAAYCEAVGRSAEELVGRSYAHVSSDPALLPLLEKVRNTEEPAQFKEVAHRPSGREGHAEVYWDCSARPIFRTNGTISGVVVSAIDVTDRVQARRTLEEANRRKDEFVAMLAHELRNPLAAIASAVELLNLKTPDQPELTRVRDAATRQIFHMKRLLDDLLDVSRITRGKITLERQKVDITEIVQRVVQSSDPLMQCSRHRIVVDASDEPMVVEADPERLVQVVSNLLSNAVKFSSPGGTIWVSVHRAGDHVELRVRDEGAGIEPHVLPYVFDLFVQSERGLDRTQGGLGIGLTLVKRLVEMHGGTVDAHSDGADRGSEFVVRVPMATVGQRRPRSLPHRDPSRGASRKIVLVEDNADVADTLAALLENAHHDVVAVRDGPSAIEAVKRQRPNAVLLDIGLPGMSGYEVAQRLHDELGAETPLLIALTGYGQRDDLLRGKEAGIHHYLVKPVDTRRLLSLLGE